MTTITRRKMMKAGGLSILATAGCASSLGSEGGSSGDYPSEPITTIVPFPEGGGTDTLGRALAPWLSDELGVEIVVDNIEGAAGMRGTAEGLGAEPDGYTITHILPPGGGALIYLMEDEPPADFSQMQPICGFGVTVFMIVVNSNHDVETFDELLEKYQSGEWTNFGTSSPGTPPWAATAIMHLNETDLAIENLSHYGGTGPVNQAIARDEVPAGTSVPVAAKQFIDDGTFRPVAILASRGSEVLPDVPTITDLGYPNIDGVGQLTRGFGVPNEVPEDRTDAFCEGLHNAIQSEEAEEWAEESGNAWTPLTQEEMESAWNGVINDLPEQIDVEQLSQMMEGS